MLALKVVLRRIETIQLGGIAVGLEPIQPGDKIIGPLSPELKQFLFAKQSSDKELRSRIQSARAELEAFGDKKIPAEVVERVEGAYFRALLQNKLIADTFAIEVYLSLKEIPLACLAIREGFQVVTVDIEREAKRHGLEGLLEVYEFAMKRRHARTNESQQAE